LLQQKSSQCCLIDVGGFASVVMNGLQSQVDQGE